MVIGASPPLPEVDFYREHQQLINETSVPVLDHLSLDEYEIPARRRIRLDLSQSDLSSSESLIDR